MLCRLLIFCRLIFPTSYFSKYTWIRDFLVFVVEFSEPEGLTEELSLSYWTTSPVVISFCNEPFSYFVPATWRLFVFIGVIVFIHHSILIDYLFLLISDRHVINWPFSFGFIDRVHVYVSPNYRLVWTVHF